MSILRTSRPNVSGPVPNDVMFCGEAHGRVEHMRGLPFVGTSGKEQRRFLSVFGLDIDEFYLTNVAKVYHYGNPDPTLEEIEQGVRILREEIEEVRPKIIVAVGGIAAKCFLGDGGMKISEINGVPHLPGVFDRNVLGKLGMVGMNCVVLPMIHPAAGLRSEMMKTRIFWAYMQVAKYIKQIQAGEEIIVPTIDRYPRRSYHDVSGAMLEALLGEMGKRDVMALDTEGRPGHPWSVQICFEPGQAYCLRCSRADFPKGVRALSRFLKEKRPLMILHNASTPVGCMYDVTMCREMGIDLSKLKIFDTMHDAYRRRIEPWKLSVLGWRCAGMRSVDYSETVGSTIKQIKYLERVRDMELPSPGKYTVMESNGQQVEYSPRSFSSRAKQFLGRIEKDNGYYSTSLELRKKWEIISGSSKPRSEILKELKTELEYAVGQMPETTLEDLPRNDAVHYACQDADATMRIFLYRGGCASKAHLQDMEVLKICEEMQVNGMQCDVEFFENLKLNIDSRLKVLEGRVSVEYCDGRYFNPNSTPLVAWILERNKVKVEKRTKKTGVLATGTDSIQHLRADVPLVNDILTCRELRKKRTFANMVLSSRDRDTGRIKYCLSMSTASRRLTSSDRLNILAIPKEDRHGMNIRDGFVAEEGMYMFSADYGQQELRFLSHESKDKSMCDVFDRGGDIHTATAREIFGREDVSKAERDIGKIINFGIVYGIGAGGLYQQLHSRGLKDWSKDRCQEFMDETMKLYAGVKRYKMEVVKGVHRNLCIVKDHWGMIRYLPSISDRDVKLRAEAEREAVSLRIQGGAQGQTQNAMAWIGRRVRKMKKKLQVDIRWLLQFHDEFLFMVEIRAAKMLRELVLHGMVHKCGIKLRVPVVAEGNFATTWGGVK